MSHVLPSAKEGVAAGHPPARTDPSLVRAVWNGTRRFRPVLVLLAGLVVVLSLLEPSFFSLVNLQNVATSVSVLWIVALGATFVQLSGGIDLSSGAVAALAGICLAKLVGTGLPGALVIVIVIAFGAAVGAVVNGIPVGIFRLNVFVVTLASMTAITGVVSLWSGYSVDLRDVVGGRLAGHQQLPRHADADLDHGGGVPALPVRPAADLLRPRHLRRRRQHHRGPAVRHPDVADPGYRVGRRGRHGGACRDHRGRADRRGCAAAGQHAAAERDRRHPARRQRAGRRSAASAGPSSASCSSACCRTD